MQPTEDALNVNKSLLSALRRVDSDDGVAKTFNLNYVRSLNAYYKTCHTIDQHLNVKFLKLSGLIKCHTYVFFRFFFCQALMLKWMTCINANRMRNVHRCDENNCLFFFKFMKFSQN